MPRGYPDFFGQSVFPRFGAMYHDQVSATLTGIETETLTDLALKGQIYTATVYYDTISWSYLSSISTRVWVDGQMVTSWTLNYWRNAEVILGDAFLYRYVAFDKTRDYAVVQIARPIPFEQTFKIEVVGLHASAVAALVGEAYYYQVS